MPSNGNKAKDLARIIRVARGEEPADAVFTGGNLVNTASGEVYPANVAVAGDTIAGIGDYTEAKEHIDVSGRFILPGLIDAHMHLESSLLSPTEFARAVVPHGTTSIVIDPHEIANVMGLDGIRYILKASEHLPLSLYVMASSCVPATHMESAGAAFSANEIKELLGWERVIGLAEMMNVPAVLAGAPDALDMLLAAREKGLPVDGHAPGLSGREIVAYAAAGVRSDHECTTAEEAAEKLRLGMYVMIREGSAARNMEDLLPMVTDANYRRCLLVSDDTHPSELVARGHMDHALRRAVSLGMDPVRAVQMCTINAAEAMGIPETGAVLPGWRATLCVVDNLTDFTVETVMNQGHVVVREGRLIGPMRPVTDKSVYGRVNPKPVDALSFEMRMHGEKARVIGLTENQLVTRHLVEKVKKVDGCVVADPDNDILKLAVVERHNATGRIGLGLVKGLGLKRGAMASSVAHDSHNLIVAGVTDADMAAAVMALKKSDGGFVIVVDGQVEALLPLPVAGLMSEATLEEVDREGKHLRGVAKLLGVSHEAPFVTLSFLALPVIPELKLTDHGLVDVNRFEIVDFAA